MALIRIHESLLNDPYLMEALINFFDSMEEVEHDKYRKTKDFIVVGEDVPTTEDFITVTVYNPDGIKPFVLGID